jgi:hypothetical protein
MLRTFLPFVGLALPAVAQTAPFHGFLLNWDRPTVGAHFDQVTRWNVTAESNMNRVDTDDYVDWGKNPAGDVVLRGFAGWLFDSNYQTAESFSFVGHAEDPANPNFPLLTAAFTVPNLPMPPGVTGNAYLVTATLNAPVTVPGSGDVFIGVGLPALVVPTQPYDGLWIGSITRTQTGLTIFDEPGPAGQVGGTVARDDYNCAISNGTAQYAPSSATSLSQIAFDVAVDNGGIGGVALAETNQTSLTPSNAPFGTSDFLSGLHPDINGLNPGRADNIGFGITHHTGQMPVGSPVIVMLALGPSTLGSLPLGTLTGFNPTASNGRLCIDFLSAASFVILSGPGFLPNMAEGQLMLPLTPQVRAQIAAQGPGFVLWWQGVAIDFTFAGPDLEARSTGCVKQHMQ